MGHFEDDELLALRATFPTVWVAADEKRLAQEVDPADVDLFIVGPGILLKGDVPYLGCHTICFSQNSCQLPGPNESVILMNAGHATTNAYRLPEVPLTMSRIRDADLLHLTGVRGWMRLGLAHAGIFGMGSVSEDPLPAACSGLASGALVVEEATSRVLATRYVRPTHAGAPKGMAWLPNRVFDRVRWTRAIAAEWAQADPEALPGLDAWRSCKAWQTASERKAAADIEALADERERSLAEFARGLAELQKRLDSLRDTADAGVRRLITSQGGQLVDAVAAAFEALGFSVTKLDAELEKGEPKREDLRLSEPMATSPWEAIVEVRGYAHATHKISDMLERLSRYALLYERERGRAPDKRIYVVNGEIEIQPQYRQRPLAGHDEDVAEFAVDGGLAIWAADLYRLVASDDPQAWKNARLLIRESVGKLNVDHLLAQAEAVGE